MIETGSEINTGSGVIGMIRRLLHSNSQNLPAVLRRGGSVKVPIHSCILTSDIPCLQHDSSDGVLYVIT